MLYLLPVGKLRSFLAPGQPLVNGSSGIKLFKPYVSILTSIPLWFIFDALVLVFFFFRSLLLNATFPQNVFVAD